MPDLRYGGPVLADSQLSISAFIEDRAGIPARPVPSRMVLRAVEQLHSWQLGVLVAVASWASSLFSCDELEI